MPVTNFSIANQHDLLLASAAIGLAGNADYTLTLANDVILAGTINLNGVAAGYSVALNGNGHVLLGNYTLNASGSGTLVLNAANTSFGGITFTSDGTLELATAAAAGYGIVTIQNNYWPGPPTTLKIDPGAIPTVPIALTGYWWYWNQPNLNEAIDLVGVAATVPFATLDAGYGIVVPTPAGSVTLEVTPAWGGPGATFLLTPDGNGGTMVQQTTLTLATGVTVLGAAGSTLDVAFNDVTRAPTVQAAIAPLNAAIANGTATPDLYYPGDTIPALPAGNTLELIAASPGDFALPTGPGAPATAFISNLSAPVALTVTGGDADGQIVLTGAGGLTFFGGLGAGSVFAGGGDNAATIPTSAGRQFVDLGDGSNTIRALNGNDTINTGRGYNLVRLGIAGSSVNSTGADTIIGGTASDTIATSGAATTFLTDAGSSYYGTGAGTVLGGAGSDTINTGASSDGVVFLGAGNANINLGGADTLVTGSGSSTVASSGNALIFTETGAVAMSMPTGGTTTVVGNPAQTLTIGVNNNFANGNLVVFGYGAVDFQGNISYGAATIISAGPAITVNAGLYGGAFIGGSAGNNRMYGTDPNTFYYGGGATLLIGGGNGDTLGGGSGPTTEEPAAGANTIIGGTFIDELAFRQGIVAQSVVQNFTQGTDFISLFGFPTGEAAHALANAVTAGGNETLTLSDGTSILFQGLTGLTAADFH